jgi:hypothetical protein
MHGIVKNEDVIRGVVLIDSCGMQGGTVPYVPAEAATAAQFKAGQCVIYTEAKRATGVEHDTISFGAGITVEQDGKVVR